MTINKYNSLNNQWTVGIETDKDGHRCGQLYDNNLNNKLIAALPAIWICAQTGFKQINPKLSYR